MSNAVGFGIVGCGVISATHADAIRQIAGAKMAACCDSSSDQAATFARRFDIGSEHTYTELPLLLADPSVTAVIVCTPSGTHAGIGAQCLWAGKPVLVEKPADVSIDSIDLLIAAQKETHLAASVICQHRFDAASICAHDLIMRGHLGSLILAEAEVKWFRSQEYYDSGDWRGTWDLDGGGALMNQGVHTVDLMRWLMGPVHSIYAVARTLGHDRIEVEDTICATLTFESGAIGSLIAATSAYPGFPAQLSVHGSAGSVVISGDVLHSVDLLGSTLTNTEIAQYSLGGNAAHALHVAQGGTRAAEGHKGTPTTGAASTWGDAHRAQITDFVDAILKGRPPKVDILDGRQAVEIILAAYESSRTGRAVLIS